MPDCGLQGRCPLSYRHLFGRKKEMDRAFINAIKQIAGADEVVFSIGHNTFFTHQGEATRVRYCHSELAVVGWELKSLASLHEGTRPFLDSDWDDLNDEYLPVLIAIESGILREYQQHPELKDKQVANVLTRLVSKPEIPLASNLARSIKDNLRLCLSTNDYSRKQVIGALRKVLKSVKRHHCAGGPRGYLNFIKERL